MTLDALLTWLETLDISLTVEGDRLVVDAPPATVTAALREELAVHKPALLALLAPVREFITLKGNLVLPLPALQLAWSLEDRGFQLRLGADDTVSIEPNLALNETDRAGISRWRRHLAVIIAYECPREERPQ